MRSSVRWNQYRLRLTSTDTLHSAVHRLPSLRPCLRRDLASKSTKNARDEPTSAAGESTSHNARYRRHEPRGKTRGKNQDNTSADGNIAFRSLDLKPAKADDSQHAKLPESSTLHKYRVKGGKTAPVGETSKYVHLEAVPHDLAAKIPGMARYASKRETEAVTEQFLGVQKVTKHEMVDKALRNAHAIHRQRKGQQGLDAWIDSLHADAASDGDSNEITRMRELPDESREAEPQLEQPASQTKDIMAQQFDILSAIDSKFRTSNGESADLTSNTRNASDIDWNKLPLSPLMHQRLIDARQRFRGIKRLPLEVSDYDMAKGAQYLHDAIGCMLASPVRTCRLTYARLPKDFLITMQAIQHPETRQVWELPKRLNPQNTSVEMSSDAFGQIDVSDEQAVSGAEISVQGTPSSLARNSAEATNPTEMSISLASTSPAQQKEGPSDSMIYNTIGSYVIPTQAAIQWMSKLQHKGYLRTIPRRWREKLGNALISQIRWRPDMPQFISSLMQRQIVDQLRLLKPASNELEDQLVEPCVTVDNTGSRKMKSLAKLSECAVLYLGHLEQPTGKDSSFESTIEALAKEQTTNAIIRNDLFNDSKKSDIYPPTIRIQAEDKANIIVYDLTRLLDSKFLEALRLIGYDHVAYYVKDMKDSTKLRTRLWWLAHYIG